MSDLVGRLSVLQVLLAEHHPDHHATAREAIAELERLRADLAESYRVNGRLSDLLTHTANALKGEPGELFSHSTHDLPERARAVVEREAKAREIMHQTIADIANGAAELRLRVGMARMDGWLAEGG